MISRPNQGGDRISISPVWTFLASREFEPPVRRVRAIGRDAVPLLPSLEFATPCTVSIVQPTLLFRFTKAWSHVDSNLRYCRPLLTTQGKKVNRIHDIARLSQKKEKRTLKYLKKKRQKSPKVSVLPPSPPKNDGKKKVYVSCKTTVDDVCE